MMKFVEKIHAILCLLYCGFMIPSVLDEEEAENAMEYNKKRLIA